MLLYDCFGQKNNLELHIRLCSPKPQNYKIPFQIKQQSDTSQRCQQGMQFSSFLHPFWENLRTAVHIKRFCSADIGLKLFRNPLRNPVFIRHKKYPGEYVFQTPSRWTLVLGLASAQTCLACWKSR